MNIYTRLIIYLLLDGENLSHTMNCLGELDIICSIRLNLVDTIASRHISCLTLDMDMILWVIDRRRTTVSSLHTWQQAGAIYWGKLLMLTSGRTFIIFPLYWRLWGCVIVSPGHRKQGQMASFYLKPPNINNVILKIEIFLPYEFSSFEGLYWYSLDCLMQYTVHIQSWLLNIKTNKVQTSD